MSVKDREVEALRRRNKKDRDDHARAIAAKNAELKALRESWELFDTFPHLHRLVLLLDKVRSADTTLRSPAGSGSPAAEPVTQPERGIFPDADRARTARANRRLGALADDLEQWMGPKGALVDDEIPDISRPRCHNPACPGRLIPQAFDQQICFECKIPFTEFRPAEPRRCWTRGCPFRGKSGQCPHG